ncbi:sortilin-like isoform X2 [Symsagittifera roscoffensis]|uniref:sortilin-like isoform X2 n=1 Tax=Symsagittifera roscoffensis TaxID=84072 RepID=UPI00307B2938
MKFSIKNMLPLFFIFLHWISLTDGGCQFDPILQTKHSAIIQYSLSNFVVSLMKAFNYPPTVTHDGYNYTDYDYGFSYNFRKVAPHVDLNDASINYFYLGPHPASLLLVISGTRYLHPLQTMRSTHPDADEPPNRILRATRVVWREMEGQVFKNVTDEILEDPEHYIEQTIKLKNDAKGSLLFLVSRYDQADSMYMSFTEDAGKSYKRRNIPHHVKQKLSSLAFYRRSDALQPSPSSMQRLLAANTFFTLDGGETWKEILSRGYFPSYQQKPHKTVWINDTTILTSTHTSYGISLHRCDLEKHRCRMLLYNIKNFVVRDRVIVASIYHDIHNPFNRSLYTSTDAGDVWNRAQVDSFKQHHKPYVYLMSPTLSFLTLLDENESCYDLYVSDSAHVSYSLSMKNLHQEKLVRGRVGVERLGSLESVFVVNKVEKGSDFPVMFITRNNGGSWHRASVNHTPCSRCMSMMDSETGRTLGFDYTDSYSDKTRAYDYDYTSGGTGGNSRDNFYHVATMLSHKNIPGFALSYIEKSDEKRPFAFATVDAGKEFFAIPNRGSQHFSFLVDGDVLVDFGSVSSLSLSWDRGHCWYNYSLPPIPSSERVMIITNSADPEHSSVELLVFEGVNDFITLGLETWKTLIPIRRFQIRSYIINMETLAKEVSTCSSDDVHTEEEKACVLGEQMSYRRPKEGAQTCKLHSSDEGHTHEACECTDEDFECDFGFEREEKENSDSSDDAETLSCKPLHMSEMNTTSICFHKLYLEHQKFFNTTGYRKIASDNCKGGREKYFNDLKTYPFEILCTKEDYYVAGQDKLVQKAQGSSNIGIVLGILMFIVFILCTGLFVVYLVKVKKYRIKLPSVSMPNFRSFASDFGFNKFQNEV